MIILCNELFQLFFMCSFDNSFEVEQLQ